MTPCRGTGRFGVADHLAGRPLARLPKVIAQQQEAEQAAEDDEA
jgi:hypothetical protein